MLLDRLNTYFIPKVFLSSLVICFMACCMAGRWASHSPGIGQVKRLSHFLNPMSFFYPTVSQILAGVRSNLRDDQILVIVGGNSNFNGLGQNLDELWTDRLQEDLGEKYHVVNLATPGSTGFDLGGVIFRMIEPTHKNTIFLFNTYCYNLASFDSYDAERMSAFNYFLWDAYYKGLIHFDAQTLPLIRDLRHIEAGNSITREMHLGLQLDSWLYFRDLWTYVGYNWFFTVWADQVEKRFLLPRGSLPEHRDDFLDFNQRVQLFQSSMKDLLANVLVHVDDQTRVNESGELVEKSDRWDIYRKTYREVLSEDLRQKTIVAVLWPNPYFIKMLSPSQQKLFPFVISHSVSELAKIGYTAEAVGENFLPEDFYTSYHYVASGGKKIAAQMAPLIRKMADQNGFVPKENPHD